MKGYPLELDSYESARATAIRKIKDAAEGADNHVLDGLSNELDPKERRAREANCQALRMVLEKCLDEYREGEYDFRQTKKMLCDAINRIK